MVIKNSSELEQIFMSGKYMGKKVLLELEKPLRLKPKYPIVIFSVLLAVLMCVLVFNMMLFASKFVPHEYMKYVSWTLIGFLVVGLIVDLFRAIWLLSIRYELTNEDLMVSTGILNRKKETTHLYRVKDFTILHPFHYRIFGCGNVEIKSSDHTNPEQLIQCIGDVDLFCNIFNTLVENERERKGVRQFD